MNRYTDFVTFGAALMSDFMLGYNIRWHTSLPLTEIHNQTAETLTLIDGRGLLLDGMKIVAAFEIGVYNEVFPTIFEDAIRSRESFLDYFVRLARGEIMIPYSPGKFIKYMAFLYTFAAYCTFRSRPEALDYAIMALVATVQVKNELAHIMNWVDILHEGMGMRNFYLLSRLIPEGEGAPVPPAYYRI